MKNQKGITLVALVVTIVVLLILAGVTIALVMQGDSIFGKAETAKTETNLDNVKSTVSLALLELQANYYDPATKDQVKTKALANGKLTTYLGRAGMTMPDAFGTETGDITDFSTLTITNKTLTVGTGDNAPTYTVNYSGGVLTVTKAS